MKVISKPFIIAATVATTATGMGVYAWKQENRPPVLEIYVFSLSSGRSMFIRTPEDRRILIDGGANSSVIRELTEILPFYSRRIDTIIATNSEGKNVSGLIDVIDRYDISDAYIPGLTLQSLGLAEPTDQIYDTFLNSLSRKKIPKHEVVAGQIISLDDKTSLKVVFPVLANQFTYSKASAPELLFTISIGKTSVVFAGNASNKVQKYLAGATSTDSKLGKTDILIVSHSALPANISSEFIGKLQPKYLVYSQTPSKQSGKQPSKPSSSVDPKKKIIEGPLKSIGKDSRFNIKEKGTLKVTLDGTKIIIGSP